MGLKTLRLKRGLTQKELAEKAGQPRQYISKLETGERTINNVTLEMAVRLCDALRVSNPRKLLEPDDPGDK